MRLSINWLKDFVDLTVPAADLADRLTLAGLEVEALEEVAPDFSGVVVARVNRVEPHPQADRLRLAEVTDGHTTYQVVCGAPNLTAEKLYAFAPPGAIVAGGHKIKPAKLRGIASAGMLLAEDELGLSTDHVGLMDIPQDLPLGQDFAAALNLADVVLEVAVTANRADCLSVLGLAREAAALQEQPLRHPEVILAEVAAPAHPQAKVTILDAVGCPRYAARLLFDLTVRPSPFWLRRRLQLAGIRAINNLVDVTNYVLLEYGQPLHAFDFTKLHGGEIIVRRPGPGETHFTTLDGQERPLTPETLLICDGEKPVALAGVMGGLLSEVTEATRQVLIESAYFNPGSIRRTSKRLGLSTEASYRFERGVDPEGTIHALERAAQLMAQLGGGRVLAGRLDEYPQPVHRPRLTLRASRTNAVLGTAFPQEEMQRWLTRLHLPVVKRDADTLEVQVPPFRGDLEREIDLIEEIARVAGYDQVPVSVPRGALATRRPAPEARLCGEARKLLLSHGFFEVINYSFQSEKLQALPGDGSEALRLANPLSEEQSLMRTSLLPGVLDALRRNHLKQMADVRLFELSKIFLPVAGAEQPREEQWLTGVMSGAREESSWLASKSPVDFFDLKGVVETLLQGLLIPEVSFRADALPAYLRQGARVYAGDLELGVLGEIAPQIGEKLDLEGPVWAFELNFQTLAAAAQPFPLFTPLPRYPAVYLDIALIVPEAVPASRVTQELYYHGAPWLVEARLFDVYAGAPIAAGKRSLAFRLTYRDPERTLTDEAVNRHHEALVKTLQEELGAELR
ncbi:MAG: phenylalanine--tRNA ligase subunit beta [Desulfobaccales bacterium]